MRNFIVGIVLLAFSLEAFSDTTIVCQAENKLLMAKGSDQGKYFLNNQSQTIKIDNKERVTHYVISACTESVSVTVKEDLIFIRCRWSEENWSRGAPFDELTINRYSGKFSLWEYTPDGSPWWLTEGSCSVQERKF
jgi:hypothetical protein